MRFRAFSPKQKQVLTWWCDPTARSREALICDGAVRSGKTICMGLSFFCWAMRTFQGQAFGLCGKTVTGLRRNLLGGLLPVLGELGFYWEEKVSKNLLTVRFGGRENTFYLFGGKDEGSAALIQGITLAGVLLDEVALMPRSFVEQACARCSVEGSRMWFSCNPEGPEHWFYKEWIQKREERNALYLHFTMADNPALSPGVIRRYARNFSGTFYRRFVLGEWVAAEGRVYDFFDQDWVRPPPEGEGRGKSSRRSSRARTSRSGPYRSPASSRRSSREPPDRAEGIITRPWGAAGAYPSGTYRASPWRAKRPSSRAQAASRGGRRRSKSSTAPASPRLRHSPSSSWHRGPACPSPS